LKDDSGVTRGWLGRLGLGTQGLRGGRYTPFYYKGGGPLLEFASGPKIYSYATEGRLSVTREDEPIEQLRLKLRREYEDTKDDQSEEFYM
jgi:hypothetical protein